MLAVVFLPLSHEYIYLKFNILSLLAGLHHNTGMGEGKHLSQNDFAIYNIKITY